MAVDFRQIREQVQKLGQNAPIHERRLLEIRKKALLLLRDKSLDLERLHQKVQHVVKNYDPSLRCALPIPAEGKPPPPLDASITLPPLPWQATILAADGSQIAPDRHAQVNYCLINVGAIQMELASPQAPRISIQSRLLYDEELYTESGFLTDARLALIRDLNERQRLVELAAQANPPVITFTDGPMELWGAREGGADSEFQRSLERYIDVLHRLHTLNVNTAGYVDKPGAALVVRLLEVAMLTEPERDQVQANLRRFASDAQVHSCVDLVRSDFASATAPGVLAMRVHPLWQNDQQLAVFLETITGIVS